MPVDDPVTITPYRDGPLVVRGPFRIVDQDGREMVSEGVYGEVVEPERLSFGEATVTFTDLGDGHWRARSNASPSTFNQSSDPIALPATGVYTLLVEGGPYDSGTIAYTLLVDPKGNTPPPNLAGGTALSLSVREFGLLVALARSGGGIVRREDLYQRVWGGSLRDGDR